MTDYWDMKPDWDIVVVGAGPVGLFAAAQLASCLLLFVFVLFALERASRGRMRFHGNSAGRRPQRLMLAGFRVHEVELSEFLKAGGSAKCLTLKLAEPTR